MQSVLRLPVAAQWSLLLLTFSLTQAFAPYVPMLTGVGVEIGGDRNGVPDPPLVPAGYAFSIWGVIFLGSLAIGGFGCTQRWREDRAFAAAIPWLLGAMLACTMWSLVASYSDGVLGLGWWGLSIPTFAVLLGCLLMALARWSKEVARGESRVFAKPAMRLLFGGTLGVYAGWSTAAIFANTGAWVASAPMRNFGRDELSISFGLLIAAGAASLLLISLCARHWQSTAAKLGYAGAIAWAAAAIGVKNLESQRTFALVAFAVAGAVLVAGVASVSFKQGRLSPKV